MVKAGVGLVVTKVGMTQIYQPDGEAVPVTVLQATPGVVVAHRTMERDGYTAVQVGFGPVDKETLSRPLRGQFEKSGQTPSKVLREFRVESPDEWPLGREVSVGMFAPGDVVDVIGYSKGKGFSGGVVRWGYRGGPATHGSMSHRRPGSIGGSSWPSRVFPGTRMPGRFGHEKTTVHRLRVIEVNPEARILAVTGAVPGPRRGQVVVRKTVKRVKIRVAQAPAAAKAEGKAKAPPAAAKKPEAKKK